MVIFLQCFRAPINRTVSHRELATLTDYRTRLALYRTDESLAFNHQNFPWILVWDDHEVADNSWKVIKSPSLLHREAR